MIESIANISLESLVLESQPSGSGDQAGFVNNISCNLSMQWDGINKSLRKTNIRFVIANTPEAAKNLDFISQRSNEFLQGRYHFVSNLSPYDYSTYIRDTLKEDKDYYLPSSPFSPFSSNIEAAKVIEISKRSRSGTGQDIPDGVTIFEAVIDDVVERNEAGIIIVENDRILSKKISFGIPSTTNNVSQLSCYVFAYEVLSLDSYDLFDSMCLNTGMSQIIKSTPLGNKTIYSRSFSDDPYVGMDVQEVLKSPDVEAFSIVETSDQNKFLSTLDSIQKNFVFEHMPGIRDSNIDMHKILNSSNYFSDLWLSRGSNDNNKFAFVFDIRAYLKRVSNFPFLYENDIATSILLDGNHSLSTDKQSEVREIEVFRRYCDNNTFGVANHLGTVLKNTQKTINESFSQTSVGSPTEIDVSLSTDSKNRLQFYEGEDNFSKNLSANKQTTGRFKYGVNVSVYDCSSEFMQNLLSFLEQAKNQSSKIYSQLVEGVSKYRPTNNFYNASKGLLTQDLRLIEMNIDGGNIFIYEETLRDLEMVQEISNIFTGQTNFQISKDFENQATENSGKISPEVFLHIESLCNTLYQVVYKLIEKIKPGNPSGDNPDLNKKQISQNRSRSHIAPVIETDHIFWDVYDRGSSFMYGADYIFEEDDSSTAGLSTLSLDDFGQRVQEEFSKYFQTAPGEPPGEPVGSFVGPSLAYFTPKTLRIPGRENIIQTKYSDPSSTAVDYDIDNYGEMFTDMLKVNFQVKSQGAHAPIMLKTSKQDLLSNKISNATKELMAENFSVKISDDFVSEFQVPKIIAGDSLPTVVDSRDGCGANAGSNLVSSVIGGENTITPGTEAYLTAVDSSIEAKDKTKQSGFIDSQARKEEKIGKTIKLPFLIAGELSINPTMNINEKYVDEKYNSMTALKKFLDIPANSVVDKIQNTYISSFPNQIKGMLAIAASNKKELYGATGATGYLEVCRPKLKDTEDTLDSDQLISYYGDTEDVPPYPKANDPMKTYSKFLTFWMNYKQISVVEYLHSFANSSDVGDSLTETSKFSKPKMPQWKIIDSQVISSLSSDRGASKILCRVRTMTPDDYIELVGDALSKERKDEMAPYFETKELLDMPTYNEYFYLEGDTSSPAGDAVVDTPPVSTSEQEINLQQTSTNMVGSY